MQNICYTTISLCIRALLLCVNIAL